MDDIDDSRRDVESKDDDRGSPSSPLRKVAMAGRPPLRIEDLGWTREEVVATRGRLSTFKEDWNAAGMDAYDDL